MFKVNKETNIRFGENSVRMPQKVGSARCPMEKTIVEMNPTVNA